MGRPAGRSFFFTLLRARARKAEKRAENCGTRKDPPRTGGRVGGRPRASCRASVSVCLRPFPSAHVLAGVAVRSCVRPSACLRASPSVRPRLVRPRVRALRPRPHHAPVRTPSCVHVCGRARYTRALCAKRDPEHMDRIRRPAAPGAAPGDPGPLQAACCSRRKAKSCVKRLLKKFYKMY